MIKKDKDRALPDQILEICSKNSLLTWTSLKNKVRGFKNSEIKAEVKKLIAKQKLHVICKQGRKYICQGAGDKISPVYLDDARTGLARLKKEMDNLLKLLKPVKDSEFGEIFPQKNDVTAKLTELYEMMNRYYHKFSVGNFSYADFCIECRRVCERIMQREGVKSSPIWEVRQAMYGWPNEIFDHYLRKMEKEEIIYFYEHSAPGVLSQKQIEGSLVNEKKRILFYLLWRS